MGRGPVQESMKGLVKNRYGAKTPVPRIQEKRCEQPPNDVGLTHEPDTVPMDHILSVDSRNAVNKYLSMSRHDTPLGNGAQVGKPTEQQWFSDICTYLEPYGIDPTKAFDVHVGAISSYGEDAGTYRVIGRYKKSDPRRSGKGKDVLITLTEPGKKSMYHNAVDLAEFWRKARHGHTRYSAGTPEESLIEAENTHEQILLDAKHRAPLLNNKQYNGLLYHLKENSVQHAYFFLFETPAK